MDAAPVHRGGLIKKTTMDTTLALSHKQLLLADRDPQHAAEVARLVYVSDSRPGILRRKKGKSFTYVSLAARPSRTPPCSTASAIW